MDNDLASAEIALRAIQLLGRWTRFAKGFHPFQPGCSCCADFGMSSLDDLELSLVCYLSERHLGDEGVARALREGAGYKPGEAGSVVRLLQAIGRRSAIGPVNAQAALLDTIAAALDVAEASGRDTVGQADPA